MKKTGREFARWDLDEDVKKKTSWVHMVDWGPVVPHIILSTEYPKGTPTTNRSVCYAQHLNIIAEQIQVSHRSRFKTVSEILRLSLHIGMTVLYQILIAEKDLDKGSRAKFFFDSINDMGLLLESGQIVTMIQEKHRQVKDMVRQGNISKESGEESIRNAYESVPDIHKERVYSALLGDELIQIKDSKSEIRKIVGIPEKV